MVALGGYNFLMFFEPASVFARWGRPKTEKTLAGSKKNQKALVTKPWQAQKTKKKTKVLGSMGGLGGV